jgi:hypothetical protein
MANGTGQPPEHEPPEHGPPEPHAPEPPGPMDAVVGCVQLVGLTAKLLLLLGLLVLVLAFVWAALTL